MVLTWKILKFLAKHVTQMLLPITCEVEGWKQELLSWTVTDTCHWNLPVKGGWNIDMPRAWYFSDHWSFDLFISNLDSVARRERMSFSTAISNQKRYHQSIESRDGVADDLLLHYLQLSTWGPVSGWPRFESHFVGNFGISNPMFGSVVEEAK